MNIEYIKNSTIYLSGDECLTSGERLLVDETSEGILFLSKTNVDGLYHYGYQQKEEDYHGHGPGYIWSSRASVLNATFGAKLMEAYYRPASSISYCCCAIDLSHLEPLLEGTDYEIDWTPHKSENGIDVHYYLKRRR